MGFTGSDSTGSYS